MRNTLTDIYLRSSIRKYPQVRTQQESWQKPREKIKIKEASSNVIDEKCQTLRSLKKHSDHVLQQTRLTKDSSTVEDLKQEFF